MADLPEPLTPADCDLQAFPFMPLHVARLRDSDLAAIEDPEACWYAVLLWAASWHQIPAASLPDDDVILTRLAGLGRDVATFKRHREGSLRGFVKCSDGRLYHPVVAEQAIESWGSRTEFKASRSAVAERQARWRVEQREMTARLRALGVTPPEKASKAALVSLLEANDPTFVRDPRNAEDNAHVTGDNEEGVTPPVTGVTPGNADPRNAVTPKTGTGTGTGTIPPTPVTPREGPNPQIEAVMKAGGFITLPPDHGLIREWIAAGANFEQDVIPIVTRVATEVRERTGRAPFKLKLFDAEVRTKLATDAAEIVRLQRVTAGIERLDAEQRRASG